MQTHTPLHIKKAYRFLDDYLPFNYSKETLAILNRSNIEVSPTVLRNVRTGKTTTNTDVLNALLKVAKKQKKKEELIKAQLQD